MPIPPATVVMKENSKGLLITILSGTFNMTGFTATVNLQLESSAVPPPSPVILSPTTIAQNGLSCTYTTTGSEFTGAPGFYDAELKVTNGGDILYSLTIARYLQVQPNIA
ncbi:MAG: hypothetical protein KGL39_29240 [Patescibacteria group bacterium]|nr:hypothetical protein [Patescibacteria group bacterium]